MRTPCVHKCIAPQIILLHVTSQCLMLNFRLTGRHLRVFTSYTLVLFFFFSSRRRHTRLVSDWSSDVCSSDLTALKKLDFFAGIPGLAGTLLQFGLVVEQVEMAGGPGHEELHDALGLG